MSGWEDDSKERRCQREPVESTDRVWVERVIDRLGIGVFCVDNVQQRVTRSSG